METGIVKADEIQVEKIRDELRPVLERAQAISVKDEASFTEAMELGAECAKRQRHVEDVFKPAREASHKAWKAITETIASFVNPLDQAKKLCTGKANKWRQAEESLRRAEAEAVEREARKAAEEQRLRAAVKLEEVGAVQLAETVLREPIRSPVVKPQPVAAPAGTSYRENWQAEVVDFAALVQAVKDGKVAAEVLQPNLQVLRVMAKAAKGKMEIPGVRMWDEGTVSFRTR